MSDEYVFPAYMLDDLGNPQLFSYSDPTDTPEQARAAAHVAAMIAKHGLEQTIELIEESSDYESYKVLLASDLEKWEDRAFRVQQRAGDDGHKGSTGAGRASAIGTSDGLVGITGG